PRARHPLITLLVVAPLDEIWWRSSVLVAGIATPLRILEVAGPWAPGGVRARLNVTAIARASDVVDYFVGFCRQRRVGPLAHVGGRVSVCPLRGSSSICDRAEGRYDRLMCRDP